MNQPGIQSVKQFYEILAQIEAKIGGKKVLQAYDGRMPMPERGVYFFFEPGEERTTSGAGLRCVRLAPMP